MKTQYKGNNNQRPTAPLHNLKLQISRLEWFFHSRYPNPIIANTVNELKSVLTQLNNPSQAFTIWTEPYPRIIKTIKPDHTYYKQAAFFTIKWNHKKEPFNVYFPS